MQPLNGGWWRRVKKKKMELIIMNSMILHETTEVKETTLLSLVIQFIIWPYRYTQFVSYYLSSLLLFRFFFCFASYAVSGSLFFLFFCVHTLKSFFMWRKEKSYQTEMDCRMEWKKEEKKKRTYIQHTQQKISK